MSDKKAVEELPNHYVSIRKRFKEYGEVLNDLGRVARDTGPLDEKTSQGVVHSHAKRAMELGASPDEVYHSLILLTSTIGFPNVAAAISWVDDLFKD